MPTFSQQLQQQQDNRPTRTQRVQVQYERQQEAERVAKAIELQKAEFSDIKSLYQYKQKYENVPSDLKPYFSSPEEVQAGQQAKIAQEQTYYLKSLQDAQDKLDRARAELADYNEYARTSNSSKDNLRAGRESREQDVQYAESYLNYLRGNEGKISQGYTNDDVKNFAEQRVDFEKNRDQMRYQERKEAEKRLKEYEESKMPSDFNAVVKQYFVDPTGKETLLSEKLYKSGELVGEINLKSPEKSYYRGEPTRFSTNKEVIDISPDKYKLYEKVEVTEKIHPVNEYIPSNILEGYDSNNIKYGYQTRGTISNLPTVNIVPDTKQYKSVIVMNEKGEAVLTKKEMDTADKIEQFSYTNKIYNEGLQYFEAPRLFLYGMAGLVTTPLSPLYTKYYDIGSLREDTSEPTKIYRGVLSFTKTALLFSNPITAIPSGSYFGAEAVKGVAENPLIYLANTLRYVKSEPYEFVGSVAGGFVGEKLPSYTGGKLGNLKYLENEKIPSYIEPETKFSGRAEEGRSTLLLKDVTGDFILFKSKGSGEYITAGGKVESGESSMAGLFRELKEETGLTRDDLQNIEYTGKFGNAEELQKVYVATLKEGSLSKIRTSSDVTDVALFDPNAFKGVYGGTPKNPVNINYGGILGIGAKRVRLSDAVLIERYMNIEAIKTEFKLTNNDYDILSDEAKIYMIENFGEKSIIGKTNKELTIDYLLGLKGQLPEKQKILINEGEIGIYQQSRYDVPFKEGQELYETGEPQLIVSGTKNPLVMSKNFLVKELKVEPISTRGGAGRVKPQGIYFQPPEVPSSTRGYLGASYVLGSGELAGIKLSLFPIFAKKNVLYAKEILSNRLTARAFEMKSEGASKKEVQAFLNKNAKAGELIPTLKTIYGIESERIATVGTEFRFGKARKINLGNKAVNVREIKMIKNEELKITLRELMENYQTSNVFKREIIGRDIKEITGISPDELNTDIETVALSDALASLSDKNVVTEKLSIFKERISPRYEYSLINEPSSIYETKIGSGYEIPVESFQEMNPPIEPEIYLPPEIKIGSGIREPPFNPQRNITEQLMQWDEKGKRRKKKMRKMKVDEIKGLLPDFTAIALGLDAPEYDLKQALKEMSRIQTGFETRVGGRLKGNNAERSVLKQALRGI